MLRAKALTFGGVESERGRLFPVGGAIAISGEGCLTAMDHAELGIDHRRSHRPSTDMLLERTFDKIEFKQRSFDTVDRSLESISGLLKGTVQQDGSGRN
jgi:hypothetical protein